MHVGEIEDNRRIGLYACMLQNSVNVFSCNIERGTVSNNQGFFPTEKVGKHTCSFLNCTFTENESMRLSGLFEGQL